jgi:hypothetical protein
MESLVRDIERDFQTLVETRRLAPALSNECACECKRAVVPGDENREKQRRARQSRDDQQPVVAMEPRSECWCRGNLDVASYLGRAACVRKCLAANSVSAAAVNSRNESGMTCLALAYLRGHDELCLLLLERHGASPLTGVDASALVRMNGSFAHQLRVRRTRELAAVVTIQTWWRRQNR